MITLGLIVWLAVGFLMAFIILCRMISRTPEMPTMECWWVLGVGVIVGPWMIVPLWIEWSHARR